MVDAVQSQNTFNSIKYTTAYGENCVATKNNDVVTIKGDKFGTREMSLNDFNECFVKDQQKVQLERTPQTDEVCFSRQ